MVARITGVPQERFLEICELIASTSSPDRAMTSLYALGWTQHTVGSQNIRAIAMPADCCSATSACPAAG